MRIFLAGASGVIGRRLGLLLREAGHAVIGTTRSTGKAAQLRASGVEPAVVDVFDAAALQEAVLHARPDIVIHQLTELPQRLEEVGVEVLARNSRLRIEGTRNLVAAARIAGARRLIVQSIAFAYAEGARPHREGDPFAVAEGDAPGAVTARGVRALESAVLTASGLEGVVLRHGRLYGPGTWRESAGAPPSLHVDAAAHAALLAVTRGASGIYNIAEEDGAVSVAKARKELGFDPTFRIPAQTAC